MSRFRFFFSREYQTLGDRNIWRSMVSRYADLMRINREASRMRCLFLALLPAIALASAQTKSGESVADSAPRLEIRVTKPPTWNDGCLKLRIERLNTSKTAVFLPFSGLLIASSATESSSVDIKSEKQRWVTAFGASDVVIRDVKRLAAGHSERDEYCLQPTIAVVNPEKETSREIPVRGRLKIIATYYPPQEDWQISKAQREELMRTPPSEWKIPDRSRPLSTSVEREIPCRRTGCPLECRVPPLIFPGEDVWIPDITAHNTQYIERGNAINLELARTQPSCPD